MSEYPVPVTSGEVRLTFPAWIRRHSGSKSLDTADAYAAPFQNCQWLPIINDLMRTAVVEAVVETRGRFWLKLKITTQSAEGSIFLPEPSDVTAVTAALDAEKLVLSAENQSALATLAGICDWPAQAGGFLFPTDMVAPINAGWCAIAKDTPEKWQNAVAFFAAPNGDMAVINSEGEVAWLRLTSGGLAEPSTTLQEFVATFVALKLSDPSAVVDSWSRQRIE